MAQGVVPVGFLDAGAPILLVVGSTLGVGLVEIAHLLTDALVEGREMFDLSTEMEARFFARLRGPCLWALAAWAATRVCR